MMRATLISSLLLSLLGCSQSFDDVGNGFLNSASETPVVVSETLDVETIEELHSIGETQYQAHCENCHGGNGAGNPGTSILSSVRSGTAISHTWQAMPPSNPSKCDSDCATAVIAWVANQNGIELSIQIGSDGSTPSDDTPIEKVTTLEPRSQTLRRATTLFGQSLPTIIAGNSDLNENELRQAIKSTMTGEGFRQFIKDGANDQLLVRGITQNAYRTINTSIERAYPEYQKGLDANKYTYKTLSVEFAESPLELIYHVVSNEKPYSEILTADYVMVSTNMATIYETGLAVSEGDWIPAQDNGQRLTGDRYAAYNNWDESRKATRPHAGLLTSWAFTARYPTTATNRNRARAKQTMLHFLGYDIEASAPRLDLDDSIDSENPTLENPACTSCHNIMDPIAGAFQNFGDKGLFNESRYGLDSLDNGYKSEDQYENGDTWYADMLAPGYYDFVAPQGSNGEGQSNSIVWLAQQIVNDERFATAAVKFWWSAVFGRDVQDSDFELIEILASDFRTHMNLKNLLVDMVMSDAYRLGELNQTVQPRLVTPELMSGKYAALSTVESSFAQDHLLFFGGHDSWTMTKRERDINSIMVNVLKNNAYKNSCKMSFDDFYLPAQDRKIFSGIELDVVANSLKRFETVSSTSKEWIDTETTINVTGQTDLSLVIRSNGSADSYLANIKLVTEAGVVIYDGAPALAEVHGGEVVKTSRPSGDKMGFRELYDNAIVKLPSLPVGTDNVVLTITIHARYDDSQPASIIVDALGNNSKQSFASDRIRYQLIDMAQLLWNETYSVDSIEIDELLKLFSALQHNAQVRGNTDTSSGSTYQCEGVSRVRQFDVDYTFAAWKGVLTAMLSDVSFLLN